MDVKDETVILDMGSGTYYGLDGVGARVWELLEQPKRFAELCAADTAARPVPRAWYKRSWDAGCSHVSA